MIDNEFTLRDDYLWLRSVRRESRSVERIVAHYKLERQLAESLRLSNRHERQDLYGSSYDQLFAQLSDHPQWSITKEARRKQAKMQAYALKPLLNANSEVAEVGCGDGELVKVIAGQVRSCIGIDVTDRLIEGDRPENLHFALSNGIDLIIPDNSIDLVISNHLIEHMHDDDVPLQLAEIRRVLRPGGLYVCATPNRIMGPHDISVFFGYEPRGFHLREYDHRSLGQVFRQAGFRQLRAIGLLKGRRYNMPLTLVNLVEASLDLIPAVIRRRLLHVETLYRLNQVMVVGVS